MAGIDDIYLTVCSNCRQEYCIEERDYPVYCHFCWWHCKGCTRYFLNDKEPITMIKLPKDVMNNTGPIKFRTVCIECTEIHNAELPTKGVQLPDPGPNDKMQQLDK